MAKQRQTSTTTLKRARAQLARLLEVSAALTEATTPREVADIALSQTLAALRGQSGAFAVLTPDGNALQLIADSGYPSELIEPWRRIPCDAPVPLAESVRRGELLLVRSRAEAEQRYPQLHALRTHMPDVAWAHVPLMRGGHAIGALTISFTTPQTFPRDVQDVLIAIAQQCAQALERAWLYEAEQQARAAAEAAVQQRDNLIAVLSHDLKNPLTTIMGRTMILQRQAAREHPVEHATLQRSIAAISNAAVSMREQIDELLDSTSLQAGQTLALQLDVVDLAALISGLAAQQSLSEQHRLTLKGVEEPCECLCDSLRLKRVLANLLANAVKYSPAGGEVRVELSERHDGEGSWVEIAVADEGIGIPEAEIGLIFEPFFRGSNGAALTNGTGLGLTSARQVVEQHGGRLSVASREGNGSVFRIRLPLRRNLKPGPEQGRLLAIAAGASAVTNDWSTSEC